MTPIEREIIEKISGLDEAHQRQVLDFIRRLETKHNVEKRSEQPRTFLAIELLKLSLEERNRVVHAAFDRIADDDVEVFDAYGDEDVDEYTV